MPVIGVGVDALEITRMRVALTRTPSLAARLFTEAERATCTVAGGGLKVRGLAARFAAKEAVAKALGTGLRGFAFRDIEVCTDPLGKPEVVLHQGAAARAERIGVDRVHVSLTTSGGLALAHAVAEGPGTGNPS